jgi:phosphoribosyl 1,2-cyclic phosphate phosphodiesterase
MPLRVKILGSGTANGLPSPFCDCETCRRARASQDPRDLRRRTSYLIDDDTIVDFGPDAYWQSVTYGVKLHRLKRILHTHRHGDHINPELLCYRRTGWSMNHTRLKLFASKPTLIALQTWALQNEGVRSFDEMDIDDVCLTAGHAVTDGSDLDILPLAAKHHHIEALVYLLTRNGRTVFIGNDSGYYPEETWKVLEGKHLDLAFLDATFGLFKADYDDDHMGAATTLRAIMRLREMKCLTEDSQVFGIHFSHAGHALHSELEAYFAPHHIGVAYDGLEVAVP